MTFLQELETRRLMGTLLRKAWFICLVTVLSVMFGVIIARYWVTPKYQASALFYVNTSITIGKEEQPTGESDPTGETEGEIVIIGDISAAKQLVDSYMVILQTGKTLTQVKEHAATGASIEQLRSMISAASVSSTEFFQVVVTGTDPEETYQVANAIAAVLPGQVSSIMDSSSATIVDTAVKPSAPAIPNRILYILVAIVVGGVFSVVAVVAGLLMDSRVRDIADLPDRYDILATIPHMGNKNSPSAFVGKNMSYEAMECYKLLRTKLQLSFADVEGCRVIGVTGTQSGEGKSLTCVNLAHSLTQLGSRILLIDCDLRRPTLFEKLPIERTPGLTDYLTGQCPASEIFQSCGFSEDIGIMQVIAAGTEPPEPVKLLASEKMQNLLTRLRQEYDYILLDLPPVGEVSDALTVASQTDGMIPVVRQNLCHRNALNDALKQLEFVNTHILGLVYNGVTAKKDTYRGRFSRKTQGKV